MQAWLFLETSQCNPANIASPKKKHTIVSIDKNNLLTKYSTHLKEIEYKLFINSS